MVRQQPTGRVVALATLASFLNGCYAQAPLTAPAPDPGMRITAQVTDTGAVAMGNAIGPGAVEVEGVVAAADSATWRLHLVRVQQRGGVSTAWNREVVAFPRNALTGARVKRLDKTRSWIAAGLVTAAAAAIALLFGPGLVGGGDGGGPVNPA
jgi:hypothetical protein